MTSGDRIITTLLGGAVVSSFVAVFVWFRTMRAEDKKKEDRQMELDKMRDDHAYSIETASGRKLHPWQNETLKKIMEDKGNEGHRNR